MSQAPKPSKKSNRKLQATFLLGILMSGLTFAGLVTSDVIPYEWLLPEPPANINGVWVEQAVADYASESFEVRSDGVYVNGRVASTHYEWDGNELSYQYGDEKYVYSYFSGEFMRKSPSHYVSVFSRQVL
ncbi:hypothetical protein A3K86_12535 [Photobacterium jeanii]|uniref:DUF2850 domain-containing protein n=1 Tax=Photobacterium jeanii TaxID=858640 RepID=A0A178KBM4_9GAMM|nr:DUF2850 domain-containing protein [Photobacterium jeanii]OAN14033.1 hypothetical protein A3K86_12535 [Photobacterium jeanii]PST86954.1 DUF2850 domain-containing protein [Photobacterium jeanii]